MEIYPVIHVTSTADQAASQAELAFAMGADGVYLIDHNAGWVAGRLMESFTEVVALDPSGKSFVGLNILGKTGFSAFRALRNSLANQEIPRLPNGLWVDTYLEERDDLDGFRGFNKELKKVSYLGGVSFKWVDATEDPEIAARQALDAVGSVDVVTTSGIETGVPPTPKKIEAMRAAIGEKPLAIASGITPDNVHLYPWADQILVSTSIETEPGSGTFDPNELKRMIDAAHAVQKS